MKQSEILEFEENVKQILKKAYNYSFTRQSVFYNMIGDPDFCYNTLYDPTVMRASSSLTTIYKKYKEGEYLPKIKITK